jgi:hypothetical protein
MQRLCLLDLTRQVHQLILRLRVAGPSFPSQWGWRRLHSRPQRITTESSSELKIEETVFAAQLCAPLALSGDMSTETVYLKLNKHQETNIVCVHRGSSSEKVRLKPIEQMLVLEMMFTETDVEIR